MKQMITASKAPRAITVIGYCLLSCLYHRDYSHKPKPSKVQDYRRTLYWNPNACLDADGRFTATFYNNSKPTRMKVSATPANDRNAVELTMMSNVVVDYEKEHYPIGKPTVAQLIQLSLDEKNMTQKQLATEIGVSPSRISDYVSGRSEPTLKIARLLCSTLGITPAAMLGC